MMDKQLSLIESEIKRHEFGKAPRTLYEPLRYIMTLGGKRMRPLLLLMAYRLYKDDWERVVRYGVAVEAFHNFTLIHDDIMDNAPLRRGKPTVHERWNVNTAILSGDVMLVKVYDLFLDLDGELLKRSLKLFDACAAGVCEGQQWDMEFETRKRITEKEYIEMIRLKTAVLLGFSLEFGALLAGAPDKDQQLLREAGTYLGIGFQLKDDLLDVYGDKKKFGKQVGGDIIANKKTFLLIQAQKRAQGNEKRELQKWIATRKNPQRKIAAITRIYDRLGVRAATEKRIQELFELAFEKLKLLSAGARTLELEEFARGLAERQR